MAFWRFKRVFRKIFEARHCEERSDEAIHGGRQMDCRVAFGSSQ